MDKNKAELSEHIFDKVYEALTNECFENRI